MIRLLAVLLWVLALVAQDTPSQQAQKLAEKLRSEKIDERGEAERQLQALGKAALPELRLAAKDKDPACATIARQVIWRVTLGAPLAAKVKELDPDFEDTAPWEEDATWTAFFLDATKPREAREDPELFRPRELETFFPNALRGAKTAEEIEQVVGAAAGRRMAIALPEAVKLLSHAEPQLRRDALYWLLRLGAREFLPQILARMDDPDSEVRAAAFEAAAMFRATEAKPRLLEILRHQDAGSRAGAANVLGRIGARDAIGPLMGLLDDSSRQARSAASTALVRLRAVDRISELATLQQSGPGRAREHALDVLAGLEAAEAVPGLRAALKDRRPDRRVWAMQMLEAIDPPGLVQDLVGMLDDRESRVLHWAAQALTGLRAREAIPKIVKVLEDKDARGTAIWYVQQLEVKETIPYFLKQLELPERRKEALEVLGRLQAEEAIPAILKLFDDENADTRNAAMAALGAIKCRKSVETLSKLLGHENLAFRTYAASALAGLGSAESIPLLRRRLPDADEWERAEIAAALARLGDKEGLNLLLGLLLNGQVPARHVAIGTLSSLKPAGVTAQVRRALQDSDPQVQDTALRFLSDVRCKEAIPDIVPLLTSDGTGPGFWAARMIVTLGARETIPEARKLLKNPSPDVRARIVEMLANLGDRESIPDCLALLQDPKVDHVALQALGDLGAVEALPQIRRFLDHDQPALRAGAAVALGKLGLKEAVPDLIRMLRDENDIVIRQAVESMVELGARSAVPDLLRVWAGGVIDMDAALMKLGGLDSSEAVRDRALNEFGSFPLNAVRRPDVWARLEGRIYVRRPEDTVREALERISREAGLPLEWPRASENHRDWFSETQWQFGGSTLSDPWIARPTHARLSLLRALEGTAASAWCAVVLESDRIRVVDHGEARKFWRKWLREERPK